MQTAAAAGHHQLQAFVESVRMRTLGTYGYQQIQVDVQYLKVHLWRFVPDEQYVNHPESGHACIPM